MTLLSQIQLLFRVSRPLSWIIAPAIWFSGLIHSGTYALTVEGLLFVVALSFPICLITFGVNDVYDYNSDAQNQRKNNKWTDGTALNPVYHEYILQAARVLTVLVILFTLPASIKTPRLLSYTISLLCLIWAYSSPPFRIKERPILDSLSNGIICWLFWTCGYTFSRDTSLEHLSKHGWFVLLYASALHSLAAMVDAHVDSSARYRTIATVYGERFAALFSMICFIFASFTVNLWSDVGIAISAGIFTSLILVFAPYTKNLLVRLAFAGSYLGSIVWVLKKIIRIQNGQDVTGSW